MANFSPETLQQARDAGYNDDQIYDHLSQTDPRFDTARQAGYKLDDVASHFAAKAAPTLPTQVVTPDIQSGEVAPPVITESVPERPSAVAQEAVGAAPTSQVAANLGGAVTDIVRGIPQMALDTAKMGYEGLKFAALPQERPQILEKAVTQGLEQGRQLASDVQSPLGSRESFRGIAQLGMMAAPALGDILFPKTEIAPPVQTEVAPTTVPPLTETLFGKEKQPLVDAVNEGLTEAEQQVKYGTQPDLGKVEPVAPDLPTGTGDILEYPTAIPNAVTQDVGQVENLKGKTIFPVIRNTKTGEIYTGNTHATALSKAEAQNDTGRFEMGWMSKDGAYGRKYRNTNTDVEIQGKLSPEDQAKMDVLNKEFLESNDIERKFQIIEEGDKIYQAARKPSPVSEASVSTTATPLTQTERSISGNKTPVAQTRAEGTDVAKPISVLSGKYGKGKIGSQEIASRKTLIQPAHDVLGVPKPVSDLVDFLDSKFPRIMGTIKSFRVAKSTDMPESRFGGHVPAAIKIKADGTVEVLVNESKISSPLNLAEDVGHELAHVTEYRKQTPQSSETLRAINDVQGGDYEAYKNDPKEIRARQIGTQIRDRYWQHLLEKEKATAKPNVVRTTPTGATVETPSVPEGEIGATAKTSQEIPTGSVTPETPTVVTGQPPSEPSPQALGITPRMPQFIRSIADYFVNNTPSQIWNSIKGPLDATLGKTFAKTTIADRQSGELGAKWISSRIAAPHLADTFVTQVLEGSGIDPVKFGAALTEDNLRSIKASSPDPQSVTSIIGANNSPFQTEAEYQSFLNDPATQQAIQRHQALWEQTVDPMFRQAQSLDPNEPLPTRGEQTSARINLFNDAQGKGNNVVSGTGGGNLTATFKRKSPFARRATGTGQDYNVNYNDMMANTFGRQLEIANKNAFEDRLVETGNAVIDKPGANPTLPDGESTEGFPSVRKSTAAFLNAAGEPQAIPIARNIYVRKSLSGEYRRGANVDLIKIPGLIRGFNNVMNKTALAGLTDASVHVMNLGTALMTRPSVMGGLLKDSLLSAFGRADVPMLIPKIISKAIKDNRAQISELSEIGAMKSEFATKNPAGKFIQWMDKTTRLILDDAYKSMVKEGLVEDTATNRREFVNQVGQYNKRAQGDLRRLARDSGFGPFATAGTTFNTLGLRTMTLSPGIKASSAMSAAALRANALSKWIGASAFVGAMNYLLTKDKGGGVTGRPGVPLGRLDTGWDDKNGNPLSIPLFDLYGLGRGLRVTGARGFIESQRKGLSLQNSFDAAWRDVFNSNVSPFLGPPIRFGMVAATGMQPAINVGRVSKVVPPGESQFQENVKQAVVDANPVLKSIALAHEPGQGVGAAVRQQIPRLSLLPSQNAEFMSKYPEIVRKAQARDYVNDVIRRARRMNPEDKQQFLDESLKKLNPEDQKNAIRTFKYSRVTGGSGPTRRR